MLVQLTAQAPGMVPVLVSKTETTISVPGLAQAPVVPPVLVILPITQVWLRPALSASSSVLLVPSVMCTIRRLTLCPRMPMNVGSDGGSVLANGLGRVTWLMAG